VGFDAFMALHYVIYLICLSLHREDHKTRCFDFGGIVCRKSAFLQYHASSDWKYACRVHDHGFQELLSHIKQYLVFYAWNLLYDFVLIVVVNDTS
jgi:hypothetical protein